LRDTTSVPGLHSFETDQEVLVPTVSIEQIREVDRIAIENQTPNLFQMMENAGRDLAEAAVSLLGSGWCQVPITVFAGNGSNGGGGVAAARHLANRGGDVSLVPSGSSRLNPILRQQLALFEETPGRLCETPGEEVGLILDAVIGYGLSGVPHGRAAEMIVAINAIGVPIISLDVPSGLDADGGRTHGVAVVPTETLTLGLPKPGLHSAAAGDVWLGDLGVPVGVYQRIGISPSPRIFETGPIVHLNRRVLAPIGGKDRGPTIDQAT
jgi:NAD(P)H-hydrate epimerase